MNRPAQVTNSFAMDDPNLEDAPFLAGGQVIRHEVFNIARVERVQVQNPVDGKLGRFVHLERLKA